MYPWLSAHRAQLRALVQGDRLGHALLLKGIDGLGKGWLADELVSMMLCQHTKDAPCRRCHSCQLDAAGNHPDHHEISGNERSIGIDAIRQLGQVLGESSCLGHGKVAIIKQADKMTDAAANALLKTLEEPAGETTLILTSSRAERLPLTIRSRCQQWLLPVPEGATVLSWLAGQGLDAGVAALNINQGSPLRTRDYLASGADGKRLQLLRQFASLHQTPQVLPPLQAGLLEQQVHLQWVQLLLLDATQLSLGLSGTPLRLHDCEPLSRALSRLGPERLNRALTGLLQLGQQLQPSSGRPLNAGLQLGRWLHDWLGLWSAPATPRID
ncbi:DNA polymerase III subunit delta' [Zobellella endophytica]|uniref:DNA polymerase III subunit delta' n=1 Tax=Zobellella endophytica TaxID=2116700 RepID=UPI001FE6B2C1|nr:DNA polymerase III subunit delta' [Zobellella endophytica]